jgi:hypothetical protein
LPSKNRVSAEVKSGTVMTRDYRHLGLTQVRSAKKSAKHL